MKLCKDCRALMIGSEASDWRPRLEHLLEHHGAVRETLTVVAESLGPLCDKCLKAMDKSIRED